MFCYRLSWKNRFFHVKQIVWNLMLYAFRNYLKLESWSDIKCLLLRWNSVWAFLLRLESCLLSDHLPHLHIPCWFKNSYHLLLILFMFCYHLSKKILFAQGLALYVVRIYISLKWFLTFSTWTASWGFIRWPLQLTSSSHSCRYNIQTTFHYILFMLYVLLLSF